MSTILFFVFAVLSLAATIVAVVRVRHPSPLAFPVMMTGWLTSEYPLFHLGWQVVVAALLIALGALEGTLAWVAAGLLATSWLGLLFARHLCRQAKPTAQAALREALGDDYLDLLSDPRRARLRTKPEPGLARHPLRNDRSGIQIDRDVRYGEHWTRNLLDIYRPSDPPDTPAPVVLQIHGGAWVIGHKGQQAQPLLHRLSRAGYVAVSINYRLGRKWRFPDQIVDVKRAIAWVRENIADYGGDPDTIVLTGGSAGGHLAMLAALTPGYAAWQPGFEDADTSVAGCAPVYGPPDFCDRHNIRGRLASMEPFLAKMVMPGPKRDEPELWDKVSPISQVGPDAPPFLVIQGANDVLVWREEARSFVAELRRVSRQPVAYWEIPGAQHAFDVLNSMRTAVAVDTVEQFVGWVESTTSVGARER